MVRPSSASPSPLPSPSLPSDDGAASQPSASASPRLGGGANFLGSWGLSSPSPTAHTSNTLLDEDSNDEDDVAHQPISPPPPSARRVLAPLQLDASPSPLMTGAGARRIAPRHAKRMSMPISPTLYPPGAPTSPTVSAPATADEDMVDLVMEVACSPQNWFNKRTGLSFQLASNIHLYRPSLLA